MIEVIGVNKSFGDHVVLQNINALFDKGKVNLIIGSSGGGKSVLSKCIVGLHEVDNGQILFDGKDVCKMNELDRRELRKKIGMLFQGGALFDSMTVENNIMFPLRMFTDMRKAEMRDKVNFCLERVNLAGKGHLYPSECSGGMKKRVAIARAIVMNPEYLFCDEPNSGLDPKTSILIDNLIQEITYEFQTTTIVITHDMNSVIEIGDTINFMFEGKNWWQGNKNEIVQTDNPQVIDFVYASKFMKQIKDKLK
ncbi:MAG: ATP-binding cassette domain-containing protein [Crocinitomicaceae bacterium]|nr:ATP-binding cassette domain-containing protein [Crocinitomicaceae bacterium]